jgi:hypothetical protein
MYRATVDSATSIPSISNSPCIRGLPRRVVLLAHRPMRSRIFVDPGAAAAPAGLPAPIGQEAAPMPADRSLGFDHLIAFRIEGNSQ